VLTRGRQGRDLPAETAHWSTITQIYEGANQIQAMTCGFSGLCCRETGCLGGETGGPFQYGARVDDWIAGLCGEQPLEERAVKAQPLP
jgi:hypothetical protein